MRSPNATPKGAITFLYWQRLERLEAIAQHYSIKQRSPSLALFAEGERGAIDSV
ncbi:MAG: hypothetical protein F6K30_11230 [Cyanothece sp. SIO2G6]|nr:hypothetical protein [Cyanothece sp. SIO2G6]